MKNVHSEIFLSISLPFMVLVVCSFLAVNCNCQPHLKMITETIWRSVLVVSTPHSVFTFVFVLLC